MGVEFGIIGTDFRLVQECRVGRGWLSKIFTGVRCEMSGRRGERAVVVRKLFRVRERGAGFLNESKERIYNIWLKPK